MPGQTPAGFLNGFLDALPIFGIFRRVSTVTARELSHVGLSLREHECWSVAIVECLAGKVPIWNVCSSELDEEPMLRWAWKAIVARVVGSFAPTVPMTVGFDGLSRTIGIVWPFLQRPG
jgi:hypothetical protein